MLQTIRDHTQGWIAGIIISIIILTFALWGIHSYFIGGGPNNIVAQVNGVDITKEQVASAYERLRRQIQLQHGANNPLTTQNQAALKDRALQGLIELQVLKDAAISEGFFISTQQIDNYLQSLPDFQVNGQFSIERFQQFLASSLISTNEFIELIRTGLLIDQPKLGILYTSAAIPNETEYAISLVNQDRDFDYVNIPVKFFLAQTATIPVEKIKSYYEENKAEFMTPEQVSVDYIELNLKDLANQLNPSDADLKNYYQENTNVFTQPMQWKLADIEIPIAENATQNEIDQAQKKADDILSAIKNGKDFKAFAVKNTLNLSSKGWLTLAQLPPDLQQTVSQLTKSNQISEPVRTKQGIIILKVMEIKESQVQPYEKVKDKVKELYSRMHAEEKFAEVRDQLADATYEHPDSLAYASQKLKLPIHTSEVFSREKVGKDISQHKKIRDIAFSNDVMNLQNNSDVIQINSETAVVMHIKTHVPSALLPFDQVTKQIENKLRNSEAEVSAEKLATDIKNKLQAGANPDQTVASYKFTWNKPGFLGHYSTKVDSAILDMAFRLPRTASQQNKPVYGMTRTPEGYAVIILKTVKEGTADEKQKLIFAEQVQNSLGLLEYELYKQSLKSNAKISIQ